MTEWKVYGEGRDSNIHSTVDKEKPISLYRNEIRSGVLIRTKRSLLRVWNWTFNRSEEDYLTRLKNEYTIGMDKLKRLRRAIPQEEKRIKDVRDGLTDHGIGGVGQVFRDAWMPRKEPTRLVEQTSFQKKKGKQDSNRPPRPAVMAELTVPHRR